MLDFEPFSLTALQKALPYIRQCAPSRSDLSAGSLFLWQAGTDLSFSVWHDTLVVRQNVGEQPAFSWPMGKDPDGMIDELLRYAAAGRLPLRFFAVDEAALQKIQADERLPAPLWAYDERWSDYIYSFEETKTFRGHKYGGQRNHINKYKSLYGEPDVRFLTPADLPAVLDMLAAYKQEHDDANRLEQLELAQAEKLLSVCGDLGLYAAGLFARGRVAAFSVGEVVGDVLLIHVEKALRRYEGAYPVMYAGFVRLMDTASPGLRLINREDDSGDPGLRTSKTQYHPIEKRHKYLVHVGSPAAKMPPDARPAAGGVVLTPFCEADKPAYLTLNTDVRSNLYWGYDYREDVSITGPIDENTFYDMAQFDMRAGDSINFAVRQSEAGDMIGEAILWNFTSDNTAELGCRLLPAYRGRGYGKAAFGAAADFAARVLGLSVTARCYKKNAASRRMIEANGFSLLREDDAFYYFKKEH